MSSIHEMQSADPPSLHTPGLLLPLARPVRPVNKPCALDVSEILHLVGEQILSWQTLTQCLLVSRSWYTTFLPLLWADIDIFPENDSPPIRVVEKHASLIRKVAFVLKRENQWTPLTFILPNLLDATFYERHDTIASFIHQHTRTLTKLSLPYLGQDYLQRVQEAMVGCQRLQSLQLSLRLTTCHQWMSLYEQLWSRVKFLSLSGSWFSNMDDGLEPNQATYVPASDEEKALLAARVGPPNIRTLLIDGQESSELVYQEYLWLITQCHELVRLEWSMHVSSGAMDIDKCPIRLLARTIRSGRCRWDKVEILRFWNQKHNCQELVVLIDTMPRLKSLDLSYGSSLDKDFWEYMQRSRRVLSMLTVLRLKGHWRIQEEAVHDLMCTMPNLEEFTAVWITDAAILGDGRPWICTKLRELEVFFVITTPSSQPEILSRLSELVRLERLDIREMYHRKVVPGQELRLTLEKGLDALKPLRRLGTLIGPKCKADMVEWGKAEVDWVLENWRQLKTVANYKLNQQLKDQMQDALGTHLFLFTK